MECMIPVQNRQRIGNISCNDAKHVVEVVCDSTRQRADSIHLLSLNEPDFQSLFLLLRPDEFRKVSYNTTDAARGAISGLQRALDRVKHVLCVLYGYPSYLANHLAAETPVVNRPDRRGFFRVKELFRSLPYMATSTTSVLITAPSAAAANASGICVVTWSIMSQPVNMLDRIVVSEMGEH